MIEGKRYFVTGIHTDAGKTIAAAVLVEKLKADYWKPVQAGFPTDTETVESLVSKETKIHPEGKILQAPMSPHAAAARENFDLKIENLELPQTNNTLIIEGAGGIMVPLNDLELVIDLAKKFEAEVILVSRNYLGSINHTLLSIEYLKSKNLPIAGILFNDDTHPESEEYILNYSGLKYLGRIERLKEITPEAIATQTKNIELP